MNEHGFIKLDRKMLDWRWYTDGNTMRVFIHLLFSANIKNNDFKNVTIHRGEVATSYASIASALGISVQAVRTAITHLKSTGEITSKQYPKFQVISIVNYNSYQAKTTVKSTGNQQATNKQSTGNQQQSKNISTNVDIKNGRMEEGASAISPSGDGSDDDEPPAIKPWEYAGFATAEEYDAYLEEKWSK